MNEWLRREGLLSLLAEPNGVTSPRKLGIDWPNTVAWGEGGYYARVFLNVRGREPDGVIEPGDYERVRTTSRAALAEIRTTAGSRSRRRSTGPRRSTRRSKGVAPDLIVISATSTARSDGRRRRGRADARERRCCPDDANHAQDGMYILAGPGVAAGGRADEHLLDVAPTVLQLLGLERPERMRGNTLVGA